LTAIVTMLLTAGGGRLAGWQRERASISVT
jgi:hypothetical protein